VSKHPDDVCRHRRVQLKEEDESLQPATDTFRRALHTLLHRVRYYLWLLEVQLIKNILHLRRACPLRVRDVVRSSDREVPEHRQADDDHDPHRQLDSCHDHIRQSSPSLRLKVEVLVKARFIKEVGTKAFLNLYWRGCTPENGIYHRAEIQIAESQIPEDEMLGGKPEDYPRETWPSKCGKCGAEAPADAIANIYTRRVYDTPSGVPEPGDLFFIVECHDQSGKCYIWDNCPGQHLHGILPTGDSWDIDSRCNNCTLKEDRLHRCWIRHGDPPNVNVDKNGLTCQAGGGSILTPRWHGFLRNGEWVT
jgi:hypothetical protein